jgi:hypothetical protein
MMTSHDHSTNGHMFGSNDHADSAGNPWEGRQFDQNPFAGDDGTMPLHLLGALTDFREQPLDAPERAAKHMALIDAVRTSRFLIPLLAEAGEYGVNEAGLVVEKTQELAIVTVAGPSGQKVLPVFTSVEAMHNWNPEARPVPMESRRAALGAVADGAKWIVVDPKSPTEFVMRRPTVEAVAKATPWAPNHIDPMMQHVFDTSIADEPFVNAIRLAAGDPDARGRDEELVVQIVLPPSLNQEDVERVIRSLSSKWAQEEIFAQRVDSMKVQLVPQHS